MKLRSVIIAALFLLFAGLTAAAADSPLIAAADSAYSADKYEEAAALYSKAIAEEGTSARLHYNLGNAWYRANRPGLAILNYERALRLDPAFEDARTNLAFVNSRIVDRPGERGTFISNALDSAASKARSNRWAWMAFAAFAVTCALAGVYIFTSEVRLRKIGFFGALAMLAVTAVGVFLALRGASIANDRTVAVVTSPSAILSTSPRQPRERSEEAMLLHEGTTVRLIDSVRSVADSVPSLWLDVEVDNTHRAWINSADVQRIR